MQPGREGTWSLGYPHSPTAISEGPETIPSPPLSFFTSPPFASQHKPHSTGSPRKQSPQSTPRLQLFSRKAGGIFSAAGPREKL